MTPLLSVAIATYNRADDLDRCIQSVLAEPGDYFEIVIGDDASPDHTPAIVAKYVHDSRVRAYRNETNLGMQENYWKLFHALRGDYVFILTDDDYLLPGALEKTVRVIREHPEVGYVLSDLPTIDERTGKIVDVHCTYPQNTFVQPGVISLATIVRSAWVLSRQVLRREWIDWATWDKFKDNIFFPMVFAGRMLLGASAYYLADTLVMHTFFNRVYWDKFGPNDLDIELKLASDRTRCMRAILHDQPRTPKIERTIADWEEQSFKSYVYLAHRGFYDLLKARGIRAGVSKLRASFDLTTAQKIDLALFPFKILFVRAQANLKELVKRLAPAFVESLRVH